MSAKPIDISSRREAESRSNANRQILEKMRGAPAQPGTLESDADPRNPNRCAHTGDPAAILKLLLTLVPALPEEIRRGRFFPGIYSTVLSVIEEYGSDDHREWADLAQVCRQEMARIRAGG